VHAHDAHPPCQRRTPPVSVPFRAGGVGAPREMAPKGGKRPIGKETEEAKDEEDAQEEEKPPKEETGAQIVRNLLDKKRISTPHPNTPFVKWAEWTCNHCEKTWYPASNYEFTTKRNSDVTSPIVKHFAKKHGSGPNSAYAEAAPITYKLRDARHSEDGEILVPARVRRAFASNARGVWNVVRAPSFGPLPSALRGAPLACLPSSHLSVHGPWPADERVWGRAVARPPPPDRPALDQKLPRGGQHPGGWESAGQRSGQGAEGVNRPA
jgi:hypothetical protein